MTIRILSEENINPFYDPRKSCNGGGYYQPYVEFEYAGKPGNILDEGCGDFGKRFSVDYDGKTYMMDEVNRSYTPFSSFTENDRGFIEALKEELNYKIYTREELKKECPA